MGRTTHGRIYSNFAIGINFGGHYLSIIQILLDCDSHAFCLFGPFILFLKEFAKYLLSGIVLQRHVYSGLC